MTTLAHYRKSIAALLTLVATWGGTALIDGGVDGVEWFGLLGAFGAALVYGVPNDMPAHEPPVVDVHLPGDGGHADIATICLVVIAVVAVLFALGLVPT